MIKGNKIYNFMDIDWQIKDIDFPINLDQFKVQKEFERYESNERIVANSSVTLNSWQYNSALNYINNNLKIVPITISNFVTSVKDIKIGYFGSSYIKLDLFIIDNKFYNMTNSNKFSTVMDYSDFTKLLAEITILKGMIKDELIITFASAKNLGLDNHELLPYKMKVLAKIDQNGAICFLK